MEIPWNFCVKKPWGISVREEIFESVAAGCVIDEFDDENSEVQQLKEGMKMELYNTVQKETYKEVHVNENLTEEQKCTIMKLVEEYQDVFSDVPKITHLIEHKIQLTTKELIRSNSYKLSYRLTEAVDKEIDELLRLGVIEPCEGSAYDSPIVVVQKRDIEQIRLCVNYKRLNVATIFDPEPMPETEDILVKLAGCKYFSSTDCCKGYYAVPMVKIARTTLHLYVTEVNSDSKS